jgi:hypothetical protein
MVRHVAAHLRASGGCNALFQSTEKLTQHKNPLKKSAKTRHNLNGYAAQDARKGSMSMREDA